MNVEPTGGHPVPSRSTRAVSYGNLSLGTLAFLGGVISVVLMQMAVGTTVVTFSVTTLLGFVFGIALSSASIVLAIAAISLGRASERTMVERSDQSIRLQNDVFVRTNEALTRIESSTGVTEKRIEDIIAGRAGAIVDQLVEHRRVSPRSRQELAREIRDSLRAEISGPTGRVLKEPTEEQKKRFDEAEQRYRDFQDRVLFHVADDPATKTRKIGSGHLKFAAGTDEFADGVFETEAGRIAVCTFSVDPALADMFGGDGLFSSFVDSLLRELATGTYQRVFCVFDAKLEFDSQFAKAMRDIREIASDDLLNRLEVVDGELGEVLETISKKLSIGA